MRDFLKKSDVKYLIILFLILLLICSLVWLCFQKNANRYQIMIDGELIYDASLQEDELLLLLQDGSVLKKSLHEDYDTSLCKNVLQVKDGEAQMIFSDCPDHLCEKQGRIYKDKQSIVCLPNRVVVTVNSQDEAYDSVAK